MENILAFLPSNISDHCKSISPDHLSQLEEIRVRIHRPLELTWRGETSFLPYIATPEDAVQLLNKISHHSIYTLEEELRRGFITIEGGHRIGLAGKVILEAGKVKAIRDISSFNIRIAKEQLGIAEPLIPYIHKGEWLHSMIIGPPQTGKTTLLRDIARIISSGDPSERFPALKVGVVDERSEIAGSVSGIPQLTFGHRLDVLDGCPKAEGMMMMIRSMSPDVLIVDEIGSHEDKEAILEAVNAGIKLIMTTHGRSFEEMKQRPTLAPIIEAGIFKRFIELDRTNGPGGIKAIKDGQGRLLQTEKQLIGL